MFFTKARKEEKPNTIGSKDINFGKSTDSIYFNTLDELEKWYIDICGTSPTSNSHVYDRFRIPTEKYGMYERGNEGSIDYNNEPDFNPNGISQGKKKNQSSFRSKLIFIHDFANGYQENEDSKTTGYYPHPNGSRFFMQFPEYVDEFVYFSHHRISVPPVSWINTCHRNKIKCLGTIIFEGDSMKDFLELDRFVDDNFKFVNYLVKLVEYFQFDGFLINIETVFSQIRLSKLLVPFINKLRNELSILDPKNSIIWYDSYILEKNKIEYVNGISNENYIFFNNSDLFLTNYWWNVNNLHENLKNIGILGVSSKLYLGCDVWGRGNLIGNGGFDIPLNLKEAVKYKSNVGLFAPAWTYEYLDRKDFLRNNTKFWIGLNDTEASSLQPSSTKNSSIATYLTPRNSPVFKTNTSGFIFYTNFSNGEGQKFFQGGNEIYPLPWVDNNFQFNIPNECYRDDKSGIQMKLSKTDSIFGGSCLKFRFSELYDDSKDNTIKILNNFTRNKITLFQFNRELKFDIIGVKYSIKVPNSSIKSTTGKFQLNLRYFIEKRYPSSNIKTRVRSGSFIIPLASTSTDKWETKEQFLESSITKTKNEVIILEDIELVYVEDVDNRKPSLSANNPYEVKNLRSAIEDSEYDALMDFNGLEHKLNEEVGLEEDNDWVFVTKDSAPVVAIVNDSKYLINSNGNGKYFGTSFRSISQSKTNNLIRPRQDSYLPLLENENDNQLISDSNVKKPMGLMNSPIIKMGELAIINTNDYRSGNYFNIKKVDKITKVVKLKDNKNHKKVLIEWNSDDYERCFGVLNYLCYVNGSFKCLSCVSSFELDDDSDSDYGKEDLGDVVNGGGAAGGAGDTSAKGNCKIGKKVRIDTMDRLGNLTKGIEISI